MPEICVVAFGNGLSDWPISVPAQQHSSSPNPLSMIPSQLYQLPASPVFMPPFPLWAYILFDGDCHSMAAAIAS